jgi:threonine synthase
MQLYSTNNPQLKADLETAVFQSLPSDNGLYMPSEIPLLKGNFLKNIHRYSFAEIAYEVAQTLLYDEVKIGVLKKMVYDAVNFPAPVVKLENDIYVLELFHGPSMAFKDFGARFMSRLMAYFLQKRSREIHILVATSGDTGGAVALGFHDVPGIRVTILYPSGKVSPVQEQQLTTLGGNVTALEVDGSFDDCQRMVKAAFLDKQLNDEFELSSANSINIARLIPQMFYYFNAYAQVRKVGGKLPIVFSVPSGNFGNLTAGLIAKKMGLPVHHFIASTNINDEVPEYLRTGEFLPRSSEHTLSNAMDVGHPSNFARMLDLFNHDVIAMRQQISGYSFTDEHTLQAIRHIFIENNYVACPHTAIAYLGLKKWLAENHHSVAGVFLSTAHPCKFPEVYDAEILKAIILPDQAKDLTSKKKVSVKMESNFSVFKEWLLSSKP